MQQEGGEGKYLVEPKYVRDTIIRNCPCCCNAISMKELSQNKTHAWKDIRPSRTMVYCPIFHLVEGHLSFLNVTSVICRSSGIAYVTRNHSTRIKKLIPTVVLSVAPYKSRSLINSISAFVAETSAFSKIGSRCNRLNFVSEKSRSAKWVVLESAEQWRSTRPSHNRSLIFIAYTPPRQHQRTDFLALGNW